MATVGEREFYQLLEKYGPPKQDLEHIDPHLVAVRPNLQKLTRYEPTTKNFLLLFGASGTGKDEIIKNVNAEDFTMLRTMTTRAPRPTDRPQSYRYVSRDQFEQLASEGFFLETNAFGAEHKHLYGTPREDVQTAVDNPKPVLAIVDYHGVESFLDLQASGEPSLQGIRLLACHIAPPSLAELKRRLLNRDGDLHRWPLVEDDLRGMRFAHYILDNDDLSHSLELINRLATASGEIVGLKPSTNEIHL